MTIEQEFSAYSYTFYILEVIGVVAIVAIAFEGLWDLLTRNRAKSETFSNVAIAGVSQLMERTVYGSILLIALVIVDVLIPWKIAISWWSWGLAILAADFTYYWMHRWEHEVRILWCFHSVHHSSPEYNLSTSLRLAWLEGTFEWIFLVPMVLMGFGAMQTIVGLLIVVSYQTWIHTERVGTLGVLDRIFNTPSVHRVHHASDAHYLDKNYGGILIIWDRIFGTYCAETNKPTFGITTPLESSNPLAINFRELGNAACDVKASGSFGEAMGYIFRPPGWKPRHHASTRVIATE